MKKEYSPFGLFFRELRKSRKETLEEASKKLGISISYISAMEHGDRLVPKELENKIVEVYELSDDDKQKLQKAVANSSENLKVSLDEVRQVLTNMAINTTQEGSEREQALARVDEFIANIVNGRRK